jgi:hypothetical protein
MAIQVARVCGQVNTYTHKHSLYQTHTHSYTERERETLYYDMMSLIRTLFCRKMIVNRKPIQKGLKTFM